MLDSRKWVGVEGQARAWVIVGQVTLERRLDDKVDRGNYVDAKCSDKSDRPARIMQDPISGGLKKRFCVALSC